MRNTWVMPLAILGIAVGAGHGARAAGQGPLVIPGIGPENYRSQPAMAPDPVQPRQQVAVGDGNLGGGFLELLVTGRDPSSGPRPMAAPPVHQQDAWPAAPAGRQPAYTRQPYQGARQPAYTVQPAYAPRQPAYTSQPVHEPRQPAYASPPPQRMQASYGAPVEPMSPARGAIAAQFQRQEVDYHGSHAAGTIVVDTPSRHLYLVQGNGRAIRYGIGVGRPGFEWAGTKSVTRKAEWPGWTPPPEMRLRRPDLPAHMEGGPNNPLGARALYLGSSLYRIHGTNEPHTIGQNVSSGCIRMMNQDVIDLYDRVPVGARVVVI